jgi:hypothetical protein
VKKEAAINNTVWQQSQSGQKSGIKNEGRGQPDSGAEDEAPDNSGKDGGAESSIYGPGIHEQYPNGSAESQGGAKVESIVVAACNFTPSPRYKYRIGVPHEGEWIEIFNSDARTYGGSGHGNFGKINTSKKSTHGRPYTISVTLPPLAIIYFKKDIIY